MEYKLKSHKDEVLQALELAVGNALEECGLIGEGYAKKLCPTATGV